LEYKEVIKACQRSLKRLQADFIDLYLIHFPSYRVPLRETMAAMEKLVEQGLLRFIGVSNFPLNLVKEAQVALAKLRFRQTR